jgi:sarcosine oxidase subunit gamma
MAEITLERTPALAGRNVEVNGVAIVPAEPATRISLRAPAESLAALSKALGMKLPTKPKTSAAKEGRAALWLGPDQWLVIDDGEADLPALCAGVAALHSAVDISHRNLAILVSGARAADVINAGCPQDLSLAAFPVGACSRTVLGKVEIVLWRTAQDVFRVEVWRSFSDYAFTLLAEAARDGA